MARGNNQSRQEKVGPRKKDCSQFGKKISPSYNYPLISSIRPYPPLCYPPDINYGDIPPPTITLWYQNPPLTTISPLRYWCVSKTVASSSSWSNGGGYLILLAGSWYAARPDPQLSKHYSTHYSTQVSKLYSLLYSILLLKNYSPSPTTLKTLLYSSTQTLLTRSPATLFWKSLLGTTRPAPQLSKHCSTLTTLPNSQNTTLLTTLLYYSNITRSAPQLSKHYSTHYSTQLSKHNSTNKSTFKVISDTTQTLLAQPHNSQNTTLLTTLHSPAPQLSK